MADVRLKSPKLMSYSELAEHMARYHDDRRVSLWAHTDAHHQVMAIRHGHRSARISDLHQTGSTDDR